MRTVFLLFYLIGTCAAHAQSYSVSEFLLDLQSKSYAISSGANGGGLVYTGVTANEAPGLPFIVDFSSSPARKKVISKRIFNNRWGAFSLIEREPKNSSVIYWRDGSTGSIRADRSLVKPADRKTRLRTNVLTVTFARLTRENGIPKPFFTSKEKFGAYYGSVPSRGKVVVAFNRPLYTSRMSALYEFGIDGSVRKLLEVNADALYAEITDEGDVIAVASKRRETSTKVPPTTTLFIRHAGEESFSSSEVALENKDQAIVRFAGRDKDGAVVALIETTFDNKTWKRMLIREDGNVSSTPSGMTLLASAPGGDYVGSRESKSNSCGKSKTLGVVLKADGTEQVIRTVSNGVGELCVDAIFRKLDDGRLIAGVRTPVTGTKIGIATLAPR